MDLPNEPILFFKAISSIVGPNDDLIIPEGSHKTDWEVELVVVIGKGASYVSEEEALDYLAGYCLHNGYSEREFQLEWAGQWLKGKSCDSSGPLGPFLVTKQEMEDLSNLRLWLKVNQKLRQDGNTSELIFGVAYLVHYISRFMSLEPCDVVELGIDGLGKSRQHIKAFNNLK